MRHRAFWASLPVLAVTLFAISHSLPLSADSAPRLRETKVVTILFQCDGTRSVSPWQARLAQGDEIEWVLDPASDVDEFEIQKKRLIGGWPFRSEHPALGNKGERASGREMKENARGTYRYDIVAMCPGPSDSRRKEVIDPDIIID